MDLQVAAIPQMKKTIKPADRFIDITPGGNVTISLAESREQLKEVGIAGSIVHTPGHSDDSVSLVLDDGSAFTGDLTHPALVGERDGGLVMASWRLLRDSGATQIYPGHGPAGPMHLLFSD